MYTPIHSEGGFCSTNCKCVATAGTPLAGSSVMKVIRLRPIVFWRVVVVLTVCGLFRFFYSPNTSQDDTLLSIENLGLDVSYGVEPYPTCTVEKRNVVFIKNHKCGSDTATNVFHRFGLDRGLSFVLAVPGRMTLNWPYVIEPGTYRWSKADGGGFNIMCEHQIYNERIISAMMPSNSEYTTILREPFSRFKSAFNFFRLEWRADIRNPEPMLTYLADIRRYEIHTRSPSNTQTKKSCMGPGWTAGQNGMSLDLGFDNGFQLDVMDQTNNVTYIRQWLQNLQKRFGLVMIMEHFEESLVLLRRLMCWRLQDVLYLVRNVAQYNFKTMQLDTIDPKLMDNYRRFNQVDIVLYDLFNTTLWRRIELEGPGYADELRHFKVVMEKVREFCYTVPPPSNDTQMVVPESDWNDAFPVTGFYCLRMANRLYNDITYIYQKNPKKVPKPRQWDKVPGC